MEKYKLLRILAYNKKYNLENEILLRKNKYNSIFTGYHIHPSFSGNPINTLDYELFCNPISEIRELCEKIFDNSINIDKIVKEIPGIAEQAVLKKIIVNEIQSTNDIEGVKSTKEELRSALDSNSKVNTNKFSRIIDTYFNILEFDSKEISGVNDIREIYDNLFKDSDTVEEYVEGELFRQESNYIYKNNKKIHSGVHPDVIVESIESLIEIMNRKDINFLIKACIVHYILEYIHPFYDGNGRLGRFIMSSYLKKKLDKYTALSISYSINQNRNRYEKLFEEVTLKNNFGELTHFVLGMLELIYEGQNSIKTLLEVSIYKMENIDFFIKKLLSENKLTDDEANILFIYSQLYVFNEYELITDNDLIGVYSKSNGCKKTSVRNVIDSLENKEYIVSVKRKPKIHEIDRSIKMMLD